MLASQVKQARENYDVKLLYFYRWLSLCRMCCLMEKKTRFIVNLTSSFSSLSHHQLENNIHACTISFRRNAINQCVTYSRKKTDLNLGGLKSQQSCMGSTINTPVYRPTNNTNILHAKSISFENLEMFTLLWVLQCSSIYNTKFCKKCNQSFGSLLNMQK